MNTKMVDKLYDYNIEKKLTEYTKEQALKDFELYSERNFQNDFNKHFKISFQEEYDEYIKIKFLNEFEMLNNNEIATAIMDMDMDIFINSISSISSEGKMTKEIIDYEEEKGLYKEIFKETRRIYLRR